MRKEPDTYTGNSLKCDCTQRFFSSLCQTNERKSRESRPGGETTLYKPLIFCPMKSPDYKVQYFD